ncbi:MAG: ester cyclase [Actinomycetota bacterium]|nr:ester cyclase [Actinomycetota bacterium]
MSSPDENKALILRFYREIDAGNIDAMDEIVPENYINHDPPFPGLASGREGLRQAFKLFWDRDPGSRDRSPDSRRRQGGHRLARRGEARGGACGDTPSGNDLDVKAVAVHRIEAGKIAEHWSAVDSAALLSQLGVIQLPKGS